MKSPFSDLDIRHMAVRIAIDSLQHVAYNEIYDIDAF